MKGKLLTTEQIKRLNKGDKVYIKPICDFVGYNDNEGLAYISFKNDCEIEIKPTCGFDRSTWLIDKSAKNDLLDIYEWMETQQIKPKEIHKQTKQERLEKEIAKEKIENIKENIATGTIHRTEEVMMSQLIDDSKIKLNNFKNTEVNYTIIYKRNGNKVICEFTNGNTIGIGIARCHEDDNFNYYTGMSIAEYRARANFYTNAAQKQVKKFN